MTDFSRNQIASLRLKASQVDRWVIPNDRHLLLRSKLGAGWSVRTNRSESYAFHDEHSHNLTEDELHHIYGVVAKASSLEHTEKERIGSLVSHYERLKERCHGDGVSKCYLCSTEFHKFRAQCQICQDCQKGVCYECCLETYNSNKDKLLLCKICSEKRELWKKSGAWFFGDIPPHTVLPDANGSMNESTRPLTPKTSPRAARRNAAVDAVADGLGNIDATSTGFGEEVQLQIRRYKPGKMYSDDSDDSDDDDSSNGSYAPSLARFKRVIDVDTLSVNSHHLAANPLISPATSARSVNSGHHDGDEISATESLQDLRQISLKPNLKSDSSAGFTHPPPHSSPLSSPFSSPAIRKKAGEVKFAPDTASQSSAALGGEKTRRAPRFDREYSRCISIPNADLDQVDYQTEQDQDSPYGSLVFTLFYQESEQRLDIELLGAQHLPDVGTSYSPYVAINLVPSIGNSRKQRTRTEDNTLAPSWKQKISYFGVSADELLYKSFIFSVTDEKLIGADHIIAEFRLPLRQVKSYELTHYHVYMERRVSVASDEALTEDERGKLLLSIRYDTSSSQLHVAVVRCAALSIPAHRDAYADPYVKLYLKPDQSKQSKKKTAVMKRSLNPEFHEEFVYTVPRNELHKRSLEVTVWNHSLSRNTFIGGVSLSMATSVTTERNHWSSVINNADRRHDCWLTLHDVINK